ncbi:hypothetical protein [Mycolicibacterium baixiangningiae]|uniref:hypothetical protein n=1 Tax=Mycolicibacterium baixiangningiae TaxID=2761578 RepID=UPI001866906D|nr:hypothetical protein [Mycolicibacterium baixiangningiae]
MSAGERLRTQLDALLKASAREVGLTLEWSESELDILDRAARTADRVEQLQAVYDREVSGEGSPTVLVKLSAELRALDRQVVDLVARLSPEVGPAKDPAKVRAANARWNRQPAVG